MKKKSNESTKELVNDIFSDSPTKEGLHTQGEWKVGKKYTSRFKEYLPILCAEPSFAATIAVVHPINNKLKEEDYANAELIVKAVNEYPILKEAGNVLCQTVKDLDNERKALLDALEEITEMAVKWSVKGITPTIHKAQTAINNAKNIKQ